MNTHPSALTVAELLAVYDTPTASAGALLCDIHDPERVAFTIVDADLSRRSLTFGELGDRSRRLASGFAAEGVTRGDRVAVLAGKSADLPAVLLAIWRLGAIHVPLFTAFAAPAVEARLIASGARAVIVDPDQRHKVPRLPGVTVIETGAQLGRLADANPPHPVSVAVGGSGVLVELFTSGTTGTPKAVPVPLRAIASFRMYLESGLDVAPDDVYWNAADPGWAYGLYYAIIAPLAAGRANILLAGGFSAERVVRVLADCGVTNFAAAPTLYRGLRTEEGARGLAIRRASSAGEPLTPDIPVWSQATWGVEVRDHYGQTEHGMVIANAWAADLIAPTRPGSMGRALPGFTVGAIDGAIAIDVHGSPLMWFNGYRDAPERTAERFTQDGAWYLTGDSGWIDDDGYVFFSGRDDDIILMAGYRIGPFDVESVLSADERVAEAAVVGKPDALRGEALVAFVVLREGVEPGDDLTGALQQRVKHDFAAHAYPREIFYVDALPKTPSGKVQRFALRERLASEVAAS